MQFLKAYASHQYSDRIFSEMNSPMNVFVKSGVSFSSLLFGVFSCVRRKEKKKMKIFNMCVASDVSIHTDTD